MFCKAVPYFKEFTAYQGSQTQAGNQNREVAFSYLSLLPLAETLRANSLASLCLTVFIYKMKYHPSQRQQPASPTAPSYQSVNGKADVEQRGGCSSSTGNCTQEHETPGFTNSLGPSEVGAGGGRGAHNTSIEWSEGQGVLVEGFLCEDQNLARQKYPKTQRSGGGKHGRQAASN